MNIFDLPNLSRQDELTTILAENKYVRIEQIISTGQVSDWFDQDQTEFLVLLDGQAELEYENDEIITLYKGDTLIIYPHQKHRVVYTSINPPCNWLCVFF
ncbi:MAG: cupin domain-containing protein [Acetobacterium sp.]